jgi:F0F1-type ATP synthase assembly protein I
MAKINQKIRKQVIKIIIWQLVIIMGLALVIFLLQGKQKGGSVFLGALAYWIPTVLFVLRATAHAGAQALGRVMTALFAGEIFKLVLSGVLFILVIKYLPVEVFYAMLGLIGAVVAFWIASVSTVYRGVSS